MTGCGAGALVSDKLLGGAGVCRAAGYHMDKGN